MHKINTPRPNNLEAQDRQLSGMMTAFPACVTLGQFPFHRLVGVGRFLQGLPPSDAIAQTGR